MYASVFHLLFLIINILPLPYIKISIYSPFSDCRICFFYKFIHFICCNMSSHLVYSISYKVFLNGISSICHQSSLLGFVLSRDYILLLPCCQEDSNSSYYLQPDTIFCNCVCQISINFSYLYLVPVFSFRCSNYSFLYFFGARKPHKIKNATMNFYDHCCKKSMLFQPIKKA